MSAELIDRVVNLASNYMLFGMIGCGIVFVLVLVLFFFIVHKIMRKM